MCHTNVVLSGGPEHRETRLRVEELYYQETTSTVKGLTDFEALMYAFLVLPSHLPPLIVKLQSWKHLPAWSRPVPRTPGCPSLPFANHTLPGCGLHLVIYGRKGAVEATILSRGALKEP